MKVPAEQLKGLLGITNVNYVRGHMRWRWLTPTLVRSIDVARRKEAIRTKVQR